MPSFVSRKWADTGTAAGSCPFGGHYCPSTMMPQAGWRGSRDLGCSGHLEGFLNRGEGVEQHPPAPVEAGLHGASGNLQDGRRVGLAQPLHVHEEEGPADVGGKGLEGVDDL